MNKKWYSFSESLEYNGTEPAFFDIENKPWTKVLKANHTIILSEINQLIESNNEGIIPYFNQTLASNAKNWTILPLYVWGKKNVVNTRNCPTTTKIIENISGMTSCSFSILNPFTSIKPHYGDSNVMYRCHLTLSSHHGLPDLGVRVKDKYMEWRNGEVFAFCDAYEHEVWNKTNTKRLVLIIDILREDFEVQKRQICAEVNATLFWQLKFQNFYFIKHLPRWSRKVLLKITALFF
jgi:aspartyl/asparaginyl beta-hydroxylase (cupin superfamily)